MKSKRINRNPILFQVAVCVFVMDTQGRQRREMTCLPLDFLDEWAARLNDAEQLPDR